MPRNPVSRVNEISIHFLRIAHGWALRLIPVVTIAAERLIVARGARNFISNRLQSVLRKKIMLV